VRREVKGKERERKGGCRRKVCRCLDLKRSVGLLQGAFANNDKIICFSHLQKKMRGEDGKEVLGCSSC